MGRRANLLIVLTLLRAQTSVWAQSTHTVSVGQFYEPPTVAALEGDTIEFLYVAGFHGVTQSAFADPCVPLLGGFDSGIVGGFVGNDTNSPPVWRLTITNASIPIWFYCGATQPSFHCANGMVGVINAPSDQYTSFSNAAKLVTTSPTQSLSVSLSGVGAVAATPPTTPPPFSVSASATATSSTSSTPQPVSTSGSPSQTSSDGETGTSKGINKAAIGGGVGGALAGCIIVALCFLLYRANRGQQPRAQSENQFMSEHTEPYKNILSPRLPGSNSHSGASEGSTSPAPHNRDWEAAATYTNRADSVRLRYQDARNFNPEVTRTTTYTVGSMGSTLPDESGVGYPYAPGLGPQRGATPNPIHSQYQQDPSVNVHELAKEVATLLRPQLSSTTIQSGLAPPRNGPPPPRALPNPHQATTNSTLQVTNSDDFRPSPMSPAPPQYEK